MEESRLEIFERYQYISERTAWMFWRRNERKVWKNLKFDYDDILSMSNLGLWKAVDKIDEKLGNVEVFLTYWCRGEICNTIRIADRKNTFGWRQGIVKEGLRKAPIVGETYLLSAGTVERGYERIDVRDSAEYFVEFYRLTDREKQMMKMRYLEGKDVEYIAEKFGIKKESVSTKISTAMRKIREEIGTV